MWFQESLIRVTTRKPTAKTISDTPLPGYKSWTQWLNSWFFAAQIQIQIQILIPKKIFKNHTNNNSFWLWLQCAQVRYVFEL